MTLNDVIKRFILSEETFIEIDEGEIDPQDFTKVKQINIGTRVIIIGKNNKRRRLVDLGILWIIANCGDLEFVRDYLDMSKSLNDVYKKYGVYTELEYIAIKDECHDKLDNDILNALLKLKFYILRIKKDGL
ncbi:MAG: hypothetical protein QXH75_03030 [Sulfolobaceae archaeon]|jgi:hypothetical protein